MKVFLVIVSLFLIQSISFSFQQNNFSTFVYHRFGDDRYPSTNISLDNFEAQLSFLSEEGYEVISLNDAFINKIETLVEEKIEKTKVVPSRIDLAIDEVQHAQGNIRVSTLAKKAELSERSLERQFLKHVGLSPKLYARIIRLGQVFKLMQENDESWSDLVYKSGFYDQSHFIKNFKEFTGEDPTSYGFDQESMANFHLNK